MLKVMGVDLFTDGFMAAVRPGNQFLEFHAEDTPGRVHNIWLAFESFVDEVAPDKIVVEDVFGRYENYAVFRYLVVVNVVVNLVAHAKGINIVNVMPHKWKKVMLGYARAAKELSIELAEQRYGLSERNHHMADALHMAEWGMQYDE